MTLESWLLIVAIILLLATLGVGVIVLRELRVLRALRSEPISVVLDDDPSTSTSGPLLAFVANPSKGSVASLKGALLARCEAEGLPEPLWLETTVDDPGVGQAREAVESGADIVVAMGGDGTVRAVATHLTTTDVPMGIIPVGTGNLLARNLDIPVTSMDDAFEVIMNGADRRIDVGWLQVTQPDSSESGESNPASSEEHLFLVISGVGFDAAMIADADANLKAKLGWIAYFVAGVRHLHGARMTTRISLDNKVFTTKLRSLMVGNCGKLPGGITLIPDAVIDDGIHDIAAIDTRGGIAGWVQLFGEVMLQGVGVQYSQNIKVGRIDHIQAKRVQVSVEGGAAVQVDGDIVGRGKTVRTWVDPKALTVRAPLPRLDQR
jgi:YegS/Rv2252/BmrU family lipid kinase